MKITARVNRCSFSLRTINFLIAKTCPHNVCYNVSLNDASALTLYWTEILKIHMLWLYGIHYSLFSQILRVHFSAKIHSAISKHIRKIHIFTTYMASCCLVRTVTRLGHLCIDFKCSASHMGRS